MIELSPRDYPNAYLVGGGIKADRRQFEDGLKDIALAIEIYRDQAVALDAKAKADDARGYNRRAEGERRRKGRIEAALQRARQVLKNVEALKGGRFIQ